jgi:hypothetical protein
LYEYAIVDGRPTSAGYEAPAEQSVARYSALCKLVPGANSVLAGLNAKYVRNVNIAYFGGGAVPTTPAIGIEVLDAWARPIRMVHPTFDGGHGGYLAGAAVTNRANLVVRERRGSTNEVPNEYSRSYRPFDPASTTGSPIGDADEGICPNRRPYFYSAGPDSDPGKREDNIYTTRPTYPQETAQYK